MNRFICALLAGLIYSTSSDATNLCRHIMESPEMLTSDEVIEIMKLTPLPGEGGYYRETYRSLVPVNEGSGSISSTAIYYMVTPSSFSALHRLKYDEIFHYYQGDPVEMLLIHPDGRNELVTLGGDIRTGQRPQIIVPAGTWQGTKLSSTGQWALMGTTMAPAFEFKDLEIGDREGLTAQYPNLADLISSYTH